MTNQEATRILTLFRDKYAAEEGLNSDFAATEKALNAIADFSGKWKDLPPSVVLCAIDTLLSKARQSTPDWSTAPDWAAHIGRMYHAKATTETRQDGDGHWYWIPKIMLTNFDRSIARLDGKDYMDDPDAFDSFEESYGKYRTLGDENICPRIFWDTTLQQRHQNPD